MNHACNIPLFFEGNKVVELDGWKRIEKNIERGGGLLGNTLRCVLLVVQKNGTDDMCCWGTANGDTVCQYRRPHVTNTFEMKWTRKNSASKCKRAHITEWGNQKRVLGFNPYCMVNYCFGNSEISFKCLTIEEMP